MVFVKILGILDILTALVVVLGHLDIAGFRPMFAVACYLAIKGFIFFGDLASFIDLLIALYIIFLFFHSFTIITVVVVIYLLQKALISLFS